MVQRNAPITYEEELKKNPELKESDVQMLREWCAKQPHLPKISDVQLALFLYKSYFSVEKTKTSIESYFTMRTHIPEFFSDRDPVESRELRRIFKTLGCVVLKKLTHDGYAIVYIKLIDVDPSNCNYADVAKYLNMVYDLMMYTEGTHPGLALICNAQGFTLAHLSSVTLMTLKKTALYFQDAFPLHLKQIHFMNSGPSLDILLRMMKPFLKKKVIEMFHFHSSAESLAPFLPLDALPNDDGGNAGNLVDMTAETVKSLEDKRAWFQTEEATMRVNESLRPGKGKTSTDLFGVEGSFRKMEID